MKIVRFPGGKSPWRNRLARSAVNRKVGGSSPPGDGSFCFNPPKIIIFSDIFVIVIIIGHLTVEANLAVIF